MDIPNLDNLIKAIECNGCLKNKCTHCPYGYQYWNDQGDRAFWWCDEDKLWKDALFYLKLYQYLINKEQIKNG